MDTEHAAQLGERAYIAAPREEWQYHEGLMTPDRLLQLVARRRVRVQRDERGVVLVCADCEGQITPLAPSPVRGRRRAEDMTEAERAQIAAELQAWGPTWPLDLPQLLADTVRHGVMIHDDALSGAEQGKTDG